MTVENVVATKNSHGAYNHPTHIQKLKTPQSYPGLSGHVPFWRSGLGDDVPQWSTSVASSNAGFPEQGHLSYRSLEPWEGKPRQPSKAY